MSCNIWFTLFYNNGCSIPAKSLRCRNQVLIPNWVIKLYVLSLSCSQGVWFVLLQELVPCFRLEFAFPKVKFLTHIYYVTKANKINRTFPQAWDTEISGSTTLRNNIEREEREDKDMGSSCSLYGTNY